MQKQDAGTQGSLSISATQFIAHKHTSLLDFFTTSHKLFRLPSLRHSGHTGHKATHWGGEEGRAGDSLEPIKLFYGNQESMKLLYEAMALQVWTSYRFSQSNSTLKQAWSPSQGIPGDPCPRCKGSCPNPPVFWVQGVATSLGCAWLHTPSLYGLVYWSELWRLQVKPNTHHCLYMHRQK